MDFSREKLLNVLIKRYSHNGQVWCERCADWLMQVEDTRLTPTICEFAEGKPISERPYLGPDGEYYSAVLIMQRRGNNDVVGALQWMLRFFQEPTSAIYTIDQPVR